MEIIKSTLKPIFIFLPIFLFSADLIGQISITRSSKGLVLSNPFNTKLQFKVYSQGISNKSSPDQIFQLYPGESKTIPIKNLKPKYFNKLIIVGEYTIESYNYDLNRYIDEYERRLKTKRILGIIRTVLKGIDTYANGGKAFQIIEGIELGIDIVKGKSYEEWEKDIEKALVEKGLMSLVDKNDKLSETLVVMGFELYDTFSQGGDTEYLAENIAKSMKLLTEEYRMTINPSEILFLRELNSLNISVLHGSANQWMFKGSEPENSYSNFNHLPLELSMNFIKNPITLQKNMVIISKLITVNLPYFTIEKLLILFLHLVEQ